MRYTIELTNKQKAQMDCIIDIVHRYVGFNPKLEPIQDSWESELDEQRQNAYDNGYNNGIEDLTHAMKVYGPLNSGDRLDYFGTNCRVETYAVGSPRNLIARVKAYEGQKKAKNTIECGDEVTILKSGIRGIVFAIRGDVYEVLSSDAKWYKLQEHQIEKTGCNLKADVTRLLDKLTSKGATDDNNKIS